jgi:hypothetical protein
MQTVIANRADQLGAKLLNLAYGWRFADALGARFVLNWIPVTPLGYVIELPEIYRPPSPDLFEIVDQPDSRTATGQDVERLGRNRGRREVLSQFPVLFYSKVGCTLLADESQEQADDHARRLLALLRYTAPVEAAIAKIEASLDLKNHIAVHLRRGDIIDLMRDPRAGPEKAYRRAHTVSARYADIETYARAVEAQGDRDVIIFSNDHDEAARLAAALSGRNVISVTDIPTLGTLSGIHRDFVEQLVMSKTAGILGMRSGFSLFPALLGDIPIIPTSAWLNAPSLIADVERLWAGMPITLGVMFIRYAEMMDRIARPEPAAEFRARAEVHFAQCPQQPKVLAQIDAVRKTPK